MILFLESCKCRIFSRVHNRVILGVIFIGGGELINIIINFMIHLNYFLVIRCCSIVMAIMLGSKKSWVFKFIESRNCQIFFINRWIIIINRIFFIRIIFILIFNRFSITWKSIRRVHCSSHIKHIIRNINNIIHRGISQFGIYWFFRICSYVVVVIIGIAFGKYFIQCASWISKIISCILVSI